MLELCVAGCMMVSLILYALLGGADFGGGMWDLLAAGPRAERQRKAVAEAIGPIWETNHVWLILVIVILFTGFPAAFAGIMTALNIPVTAMLIGIVLRGSAFIFRKYASQEEAVRRRWSKVFGIASFWTPLFQGVILGALATGQIHIVDGQVVTGFFAGWVSLFAFACGVFTLVLFSFLAATYLALHLEAEPDLQNDFRLRALGSGLCLGPVTAVVFFASWHDAPELFHGLTQWWAPVLLACVSALAILALIALWRKWFALARVAAIGQVALILAGWFLGQYPDLVSPDITLYNSHAPEITLRLLMWALGAGAVVLFPSLAFLFHLFENEEMP